MPSASLVRTIKSLRKRVAAWRKAGEYDRARAHHGRAA